jgi:hypothetical protein
MCGTAVFAWVLTVTAGLRRSQAKTLADLVSAALTVSRGTLAALGRALAGDAAAKHRIKRVWRFCDNDRVHVADAMHGVIAALTRKRKKRLLVALDWTDIRSFHTLMAAAVLKGRAIPLLWASYTDGQLFRSQNALEEGLLHLLLALLPPGLGVIVLADRGFGRAELAKTCQRLKLHYLIRIKPDVHIEHPRYCGLLSDYPIKKGTWRVLRGARYRADGVVTQDVVIRWKKGLPAKRDEPWFLMTDLPANAVQLTDLYARRMAVEELFRDGKDGRYGYALRQTQVQQPGRLDRLILILALALILLTGVGRLARGQYRPGQWCSSNDPGQCSDFTVGRLMLGQMQVSPEQAFAEVVRATFLSIPKWG